MKAARYDKPDFWALKAKKEGYPARSVYKLAELDEKFGLLKPEGARRSEPFPALDLGAAPGSWTLYLLRRLSVPRVAACDLTALTAAYFGAYTDSSALSEICGDFTTPETRAAIAARAPYRLVLCDAAPATSGNRALDSLRSLELAETAAGYAEELLFPGGNCVIKVFQGGETAALLRRLKLLFGEARTFKPAAVRPTSVETYFVCKNRLA
jgi:23S rRNA (uridine2552-2'-O)-methyltransferase